MPQPALIELECACRSQIQNSPRRVRWHSLLHRAKNDGFLVEQFKAEPLALLPEQLLFRNLWGSFEKFAGSTVIWDVRRKR